MNVKLKRDYKIGSRMRVAGTVIDVDAELREQLLASGDGEDTKVKKTKKKNIVSQSNTQ